MLDLDCKICFISFDNHQRLPRMLNCGHTYCTSCLQNLLQSVKSCPSCRKAINCTSYQEIPVNYMILDLLDSKDDLFNSRENFMEKYLTNLLKLRCDYSELNTILNSEKEKVELHLGLVESGEKTLDAMLEANNPFDKESHETFKKLEEQFSSIRSKTMPTDSLLPRDVSMLSSNFESSEKYLSEIYKGIMNDKRFAAVLRVNDVTKYAKLSVRDDFLFIHAFEETQKTGDVTTVCFKDLLGKLLKEKNTTSGTFDQDATTSEESSPIGLNSRFHVPVSRISRRMHNRHHLNQLIASRNSFSSSEVIFDGASEKIPSIYGFLDLTYGQDGLCRRVMIEVLKSASNLGSQFLKICTGESGISYKGHDYEQTLNDSLSLNNQTYFGIEKIIQLKNFNWGMEEADTFSRYFLLNNDSKTLCQGETYYLQFEADGSFEIFKHPQGNLQIPNIVGPVIDFHNNIHITFEGSQDRKILDCGVAIKM